jgi:hypothetical protein
MPPTNIETVSPFSTADGLAHLEYVSVSVVRTLGIGRWLVNIGKIEAILSHWVASIEARSAKQHGAISGRSKGFG